MSLQLWLVVAIFLVIAWLGRVIYTAKTPPSVVVASVNIRFNTAKDGPNAWPHRADRLAKQVMSHQPAILGMQEVLFDQLIDLQKLLPAHYAYVGVGRDDGRQAGEHTPIWYDSLRFSLREQGTFWLSETPEQPSRGWDAALPRICTWACLHEKSKARDWWVFNTHLDHQGEVARAQSVLLIEQMVSRLDSSAFVLLLGDFNSQSHDAPYRYLSSRGWLDARHQATQIKGPVGTFPDFDGRRPDKRIDFIWYRNLPQPWQYLADGAPERTYPLVSDHLPIYAFFGN